MLSTSSAEPPRGQGHTGAFAIRGSDFSPFARVLRPTPPRFPIGGTGWAQPRGKATHPTEAEPAAPRGEGGEGRGAQLCSDAFAGEGGCASATRRAKPRPTYRRSAGRLALIVWDWPGARQSVQQEPWAASPWSQATSFRWLRGAECAPQSERAARRLSCSDGATGQRHRQSTTLFSMYA